MMEALAALGLAANVAQFITFAIELISASLEVHSSVAGCTDELSSLDAVYRRLHDLSAGLQSGSEGELSGPPAKTKLQNTLSIESLSRECQIDCAKLIKLVDGLKTTGGGWKGPAFWHSFRSALRTALKKSEIADLEKRLGRTQVALTLQICTHVSHWQQFHAEELKKLQADCHAMGIQNSEKLEHILESQTRIQQLVAANENPQQNTFSNTSIETLQGLMSKISLTQDQTAKEQAIIRSLNFRRRPVRHAAIVEAHQKTFQWIFEDTKTDFAHWLRHGRQSFWISGKPGSGKSTLMKYIAGEKRTADLLSAWSAPQKVAIAAHFFWNAGTDMQKSEQGLLQSLLYDIFRKCPDLIERCCPKRWERLGIQEKKLKREREDDGSEVDPEWSCPELHETLRRVAGSTQQQSPVKFCIFIDGLDEYSGEHSELCETIRNLGESANIKLCVSSRPLNVFVEAFGNQAKLAVHELTRGDIEKFSTERLESHPRWRSVASVTSNAQRLISEITDRAAGVFLWVYLVIKKLREGLTNYDTFSELMRRLETFPVELDAFFRHILKSVDREYHSIMATSLRISMQAISPLHIAIYAFHDMGYEDKDYLVKQSLEPFSPQEEAEREYLIPRLNGRSGGLLEVDLAHYVNFLHRTVRDFLTNTPDMSDFLVTVGPPGFSPNLCLLETHVAAIKRSGDLLQPPTLQFNLRDILPDVVVYAQRVEKELKSATDKFAKRYYHILSELEKCINLSVILPRLEDDHDTPRETVSLFKQLVLEFKLVGYLRQKLAHDPGYIGNLDSSTMTSIFGTLGSSGGFFRAFFDLTYPPSEPPDRWSRASLNMLQQILHSCPDMHVNEQHSMSSPWIFLFLHSVTLQTNHTTPSWHPSQRFWSLLESGALFFLLEQGADPNVAVGSSTPFQIYLDLSLTLSPKDSRQKDLYIQGLGQFLEAGANLTSSLLLCQGSNTATFFDALLKFGSHQGGNMRPNLTGALLGDVIETLLAHAKTNGPALPMELVWLAVDRVLPQTRAHLLKIKYRDPRQGVHPPKRKVDPAYADWTDSDSDNSDTRESYGSRKRQKLFSSTSSPPPSDSRDASITYGTQTT